MGGIVPKPAWMIAASATRDRSSEEHAKALAELGVKPERTIQTACPIICSGCQTWIAGMGGPRRGALCEACKAGAEALVAPSESVSHADVSNAPDVSNALRSKDALRQSRWRKANPDKHAAEQRKHKRRQARRKALAGL